MKNNIYTGIKNSFVIFLLTYAIVFAEFKPNGGENGEFWTQDTKQKIVWDTNYFHGTVNIVLWDMTPAKFTTIALNIPASNGEYEWWIPINHSTGEYFRIKVQQVDTPGNYQMSATFFPIYKAKVINVLEIIPNNNDYEISPNPATDKLIIQFNNELASILELQIFNSRGQDIVELNHRVESNTNQIDINISSLSDGLYFAVIKAKGKICIKPFVVLK